jgi:hypothetical protein
MDPGICSSSKAANQPKPTNLGINSSQLGSSLAARADEMHNFYQCAVVVTIESLVRRLSAPVIVFLLTLASTATLTVELVPVV